MDRTSGMSRRGLATARAEAIARWERNCEPRPRRSELHGGVRLGRAGTAPDAAAGGPGPGAAPTAPWTICARRYPPGGPASGRPLVGMAAAALFIGTADPRRRARANSTGTTAPTPSNAGHASRRRAAPGPRARQEEGGETTSGGSAGKTEDKGKGECQGRRRTSRQGPRRHRREQRHRPLHHDRRELAGLHAPPSSARRGEHRGRPTPTGTVYGTFRITNVSTAACTVTGPGTSTSERSGRGRRRARSAVRRHVAGRRGGRAARPVPGGRPAAAAAGLGVRGEVRLGAVGHLPDHRRPRPTPAPTGDLLGRQHRRRAPPPAATPAPPPARHGGRRTADGSVPVTNTGAGRPRRQRPSRRCAGTIYRTVS